MNKFTRQLIGSGGLLLLLISSLAADPVSFNVNRTVTLYNLGLSDFIVTGTEGSPNYAVFFETLKSDLTHSKYFNVVTGGPVIKGRNEMGAWAQLGMEAVLSGTFRQNAQGKIDVFPKLSDPKSFKDVLTVSVKNPTNDAKSLAHQVANEIVQYFTGQPGIFESKLVFVNNATGRKELYVSDYDGTSVKRLTRDSSICLLPRVSNNAEHVVFTSYVSGNPDLYMMNLDGSGRRRISSRQGLNVSPSWSPANSEFAVTLSLDGNPNLYLMDLSGNIIRQLTDGPWADTAPCFSPDGSQLVFTSDRTGSPHIFVMNIDGSGLRRLTTVGHCDSAAWSPDGQVIAYVKAEGKNRFDIYSIEVLTGVERRLTWGPRDNENPAWSPDGRFIVFVSTRRGKSELFTMLADGQDQVPLNIMKGQFFTPTWTR